MQKKGERERTARGTGIKERKRKPERRQKWKDKREEIKIRRGIKEAKEKIWVQTERKERK